MKKIATALSAALTPIMAVALMIAGAVNSHADPIPQCNYPNTCFSFVVVPGIGEIRGFVIDAPMEDHGQHWHYEFGSGNFAANVGANLAVPGLQSGSGGIPVGFALTLASATWRCPDQRYEADPPVVYGTWNKDRPKPKPCVPVRRSPTAPLADWPPTTDVNIKVAWPPEAPPQPMPQNYPPIPDYGAVEPQAPLNNPDTPLPNTRQGG